MKKTVLYILLFPVFYCIIFSGCSSESNLAKQQKTSAVTGASPKMAPYITEHRYFFAGVQQTISAVTGSIKPSVVSIGNLKSGADGVLLANAGSGVLIDPRGYILTVNKTGAGRLKMGSSYKVTLFGPDHRHQFDGQIIAHDPGVNLTLVKITSPDPFPFTPLGNPALIKPGDWLIAFGSAEGLTQKVVPGVVSSSARTAKIAGRTFSGIIQTDIKTPHGCIGGPLVDLQGRVIALNIGSGRALPVSQCVPLLSCIGISPRAFQETGIEPMTGRLAAAKQQIFSDWLGAEVIPVEGKNAERLNVPWSLFGGRRGLLVNRVIEGSPADMAGIVRGDVIYKFNRYRVGTVKKLERIIRRSRPGRVVPINVVRQGVIQTLQGRVEKKPIGVELPVPAGILRGVELDWMGVEISNLTRENVSRFGIPGSLQGVVVINTEALNGTGLRIGDLIRKVNGRKVREVSEFAAVAARPGKGVLLDVLRQGEPMYITVEQ